MRVVQVPKLALQSELFLHTRCHGTAFTVLAGFLRFDCQKSSRNFVETDFLYLPPPGYGEFSKIHFETSQDVISIELRPL